MTFAKTTIDVLREDFNLQNVVEKCDEEAEQIYIVSAGVRLEADDATTKQQQHRVCLKYRDAILRNLDQRFSDDVSQLCSLQTVLQQKEETPNFVHVARLMNVSADDLIAEWKILKRLLGDMTTNQSLVDLAISSDKRAMFPTFWAAVRKTLFLPLGTATMERSFSTMNRILCSERCRLLPSHSHACKLMQQSINGVTLPLPVLLYSRKVLVIEDQFTSPCPCFRTSSPCPRALISLCC